MKRKPLLQARLEIGSIEWLVFRAGAGDPVAHAKLLERMKKGWRRRLVRLDKRGDVFARNELQRLQSKCAGDLQRDAEM